MPIALFLEKASRRLWTPRQRLSWLVALADRSVSQLVLRSRRPSQCEEAAAESWAKPTPSSKKMICALKNRGKPPVSIAKKKESRK